jgi:hypothetical protein
MYQEMDTNVCVSSTEMKGIEELKAMMIGKVSIVLDIQVLGNRL